MSTTITPTFDVAALRAAIEGQDPAALADLYTDDCVGRDRRSDPHAVQPARVEGRPPCAPSSTTSTAAT
jgi:ketosteroid isomerase-like protein